MPTTRAKKNADDRLHWLTEFIWFGRSTNSPAFNALVQYGEKLYDNFVIHDDYEQNIQDFRYTDEDGNQQKLDDITIDRLTKWRPFYIKQQEEWGLPSMHGLWDLTCVDGLIFEGYLLEEWDILDPIRIDTDKARENGQERLRIERTCGGNLKEAPIIIIIMGDHPVRGGLIIRPTLHSPHSTS